MVEPKEVWVSCRAKEGCPGNKAMMTLLAESLPLATGGGRVLRYRCLTCKGSWNLRC